MLLAFTNQSQPNGTHTKQLDHSIPVVLTGLLAKTAPGPTCAPRRRRERYRLRNVIGTRKEIPSGRDSLPESKYVHMEMSWDMFGFSGSSLVIISVENYDDLYMKCGVYARHFHECTYVSQSSCAFRDPQNSVYLSCKADKEAGKQAVRGFTSLDSSLKRYLF